MLVDVHAHLDSHQFAGDLKDVLERAKKVGMKAIIQNGLSPISNRDTLELAKKHKIIKAAVGIHPIEIIPPREHREDLAAFNLNEEIAFIQKNKSKIIAIGEIGLDLYHGSKKDLQLQMDVFERMLALAEKIKKPVLVHTRKAEEVALGILEASNVKNVVMHCFTGSEKQTFRALDNGYYFSIPAAVVRNKHFQKLAQVVPADRILTETDAPYNSPMPGTRNEPSFIEKAVPVIAKIKQLTEEEMKKIIYKNYKDVFE